MVRSKYWIGCLVPLSLVALASTARAEAETQPAPKLGQEAKFSVGYGFQSSWTSKETAGHNTPEDVPDPNGQEFRVGAFKFIVTIESGFFSSAGPTYARRHLTEGDGAGTTGDSSKTTVTVTAEYVGEGGGAADAKPAPPGRVRLDIDRIAVHAARHPQVTEATEIWWIESTPGQEGKSEPTKLRDTTYLSPAIDYLDVGWNPRDFDAAGGKVTRVFTFPSDRVFALDGMQIIGAAGIVEGGPATQPAP